MITVLIDKYLNTFAIYTHTISQKCTRSILIE